MKAEAEANAEIDRKEKETVEKINAADSLIFQTEKQFKEFGDKIPAEKKVPIENALAELKEAHKNRDIAAIDVAMEKMNTAWQAASEEMYKATQDAQQNGGANPNQEAHHEGEAKGAKDAEVTDVDFEEVK